MTEQNGGKPKDHFESRANHRTPVSGGSDLFKEGWQDIPHEEMVARMRRTVAEAKARFETKWGKDTFDPVEWVGFMVNPSGLRERTKEAEDLAIAWDALSFPFVKGQSYKHGTREGVKVHTMQHGQYVTLEPKAAKLLDVMTDALNIPHKRGEATIDLLANIPPTPERKPHTARRMLSFVAREVGSAILDALREDEPKPRKPFWRSLSDQSEEQQGIERYEDDRWKW
jgi:hypothetical protein